MATHAAGRDTAKAREKLTRIARGWPRNFIYLHRFGSAVFLRGSGDNKFGHFDGGDTRFRGIRGKHPECRHEGGRSSAGAQNCTPRCQRAL
jgi:hypothetical protein